MNIRIRRFPRALVLAPVAATVACLSTVRPGEEPWTIPAADLAGAEPWPWSSDAPVQPTRAQLDPAAPPAARPAETASSATAPPETTSPAAAAPPPPPLLSWSGEVVDGQPPGSVVEIDGERRGLGKPGERWRIIELYEAALEERDALAEEVRTLEATLERVYALLDQSEASGLALTGRITALEAEVDRLRQESGDLAARLTTAQIRRLEAEKMLLEARIETYRQRDAAAAGTAGPGAPPPGSAAAEGAGQ
ncbi:MAG: hypothetical protein AB1726_11335 [Planctomycetota bacterium]